MIVDFGHWLLATDICKESEINENATQMELEEQIYSKVSIENEGMQILFCDNGENWRDAKREKDTDLHMLPKTSFSASYFYSVKNISTIPR